jgi:hypothetical protein
MRGCLVPETYSLLISRFGCFCDSIRPIQTLIGKLLLSAGCEVVMCSENPYSLG